MGNLRVRGVGIVLRGVVGELVGELQLARGRVEARHRQDAFIRGDRVAGKRAVFKHGHAVDLDAGHAVGRADAQRAFGRGGRTGLPGLRAVVKTGFVDRQLVRTGFGVTRRHHDAVVHAVDGDGHLARGNVAVRIRIGVRELFRQLLVVRKRLHHLIVVIERVAVGAVFVQGDRAVLAALARGPGKVRAVRTGCRACKGVAIDGSAASFRHAVREALDGGHVVHDGHGDGAGRRGVVHVRHRHGKIMGNLRVRGVGIVLRSVVVQRVGERQLARGRVEARHRQDAFIRGNPVAGKRAVFKHGHVADLDAGHAVGRVDVHRTFGRGRLVAGGGAVAKAGFVHRHHFRFRRRVGRRHHDAVVHAVDGDGHLAFGNVAVRIRIGVGEFFRQRLAIGKRLHRLIVVIERVAVGAVGVQRDFAILAALVRIPGEGCIGVRTGHRAFQRVAGDGRGIPFRHAVREALDGRPVVPDGQIQSDLGTGTVAVAVRHRQLHADAVERQDIIGIAVVGMNQGTVIFQGKGDIALAVDMHIEDFRITGHADDTAFIIDGQYDRHHLATDEGNKGILRAGIQREFIAAAGFTVRTGDDSEVVADIHDILNTCTMKIAFIQLQLRLTSRRHLHGVIFHLDLKLHLA